MPKDTDKMAEMTRKIARGEYPMEREKAGSHGFPSTGDGSGGAGQTDDQSGTAPASGMAQHAAKAGRRASESD